MSCVSYEFRMGKYALVMTCAMYKVVSALIVFSSVRYFMYEK